MEQRGKARAVDGPRGEVDVGSVGKGTTSPGERVLHHTVGGPPGSRREAHAPVSRRLTVPLQNAVLAGRRRVKSQSPPGVFARRDPLRYPPEVAASSSSRLEALDSARGLAIALMVMSHTVKGLLPFKELPEWGLVPIHLVTKFSSTLFILVFGVSV